MLTCGEQTERTKNWLRWPASSRNRGRFQIGIVAGIKSEYPAGLNRNSQCIQPIFKIGTAACLFSPLCSVCIRFCKSSLLMADTRARSFKRLQPKSCRICKSKSSNAPIRQKGSSFCRDVGLSNALSLGLIAAAGWARISKISPETRSLFSTSPRFVSCSESFV